MTWRSVFGRKPTESELPDATALLSASLSGDAESQKAPFVHLCQALLSSTAFLYVD